MTTYTGPFGHDEIKHLLGRVLFGCTRSDTQFFEGQTLQQVVNYVLNVNIDQPPPVKSYGVVSNGVSNPSIVDVNVPFGQTWVNTPVTDTTYDANVYRMFTFIPWRIGLILTQPRTILEKIVLFWTNHMPIQSSVVFNALMFYQYDQLLRQNCLGNFKELITNVTLSVLMMEYLNGSLNTSSAPDENYGRELMELFTLGEGSGYTEGDVQAAARILTGWTTRFYLVMPETYFVPANHDTGNKVFSSFFNNTQINGESGDSAGINELNSLISMILSKEESSLFIVRQIYKFFVHGTISPETESDLIVPLAQIFRDNSTNSNQIKEVLYALFTSDHFFSSEVRGCMMQSPADLILGACKKLNYIYPSEVTQIEARNKIFLDIYYTLGNCGQLLFDPPNVAGWPAYYQSPQFDELWLDTANYAARNYSLQAIIGNGFYTNAEAFQPESRNLHIKPDLVEVVSNFSDPTDPNILISDLVDLFLHVPISSEVQSTLKTTKLLLGQQNDIYWSDAYEIYIADPNTTNQTAQMVPTLLLYTFLDLSGSAEIQIF